jgi:hypothetical protein
LVEDEVRSSARDAFHRTRETLQKLSRLSPQAQQYYEILTRFSSAIELYRQQLLLHERPTDNPYVEQIMTLEETGNFRGAYESHLPTCGLFTPEPSDGCEDDAIMPESGFHGSQLDIPSFMPQVGDDLGLQWMWDSYAMQLPSFSTFWEDYAHQPLESGSNVT